jgi:hypothetical protein
MRAFVPFIILMICVPCLAQSKDYFQQEVNYRMTVTLDDTSHELNAFADISYVNNSPDTLTFIWFHLWPNAYSSNKTALAKQIFRMQGKQKLFEDPLQRGFIDSLRFKINGEEAGWETLSGEPDICRVFLPAPLLPGDSVRIQTPFHVKMPIGNISRMGYNSGVYQVSQWYPKPAVYDRTGWHPMPYLDQGEYYSEFGSFDVSITLGENYVVAASGELRTESEIAWLSEVAGKWQVYDGETVPGTKTIRYTGESIHDFAWLASKRFRVMMDSVILPRSGRKVTTMVFFTGIQAYLWEKALEYANRSVLSFSEWIGDYPYSTFSAVQAPMAAGSGMEYPGLAVIGYAQDEWSLNQVITHEVAHNWFFSSLGSNERRYPFMDESLATAYEVRHMDLYYPGKKMWEMIFRKEKTARFFGLEEFPEGRLSEIGWLIPARNNLEQPLNLDAHEYSPGNYGDILYYKGGQGFNYLRSYLGDAVFDTIMHYYYVRWKERHPSPGDLRAIFESNTDRELAWFFDDYLQTTKRFDYSIEGISDGRLTVRNKGEMISPFPVTGLNGDSVVFTVWFNGFAGRKTLDLPAMDISSVRINANHLIPEVNHTNNNTRTSGLFKKADPMVPRLFMPFELPEWRTLMVVPLVNWNNADGFMAGMALNNGFILPKRIEYIAIPFYSFRKMSLAGKGRVAFNITPYNNPVRKATLYTEGAKFGATPEQDFKVLRIGLDISFRNNDFVKETGSGIFGRYILGSDLSMLMTDQDAEMLSFGQWGYSFERPSMVNPFSMIFMHETNGEYNKFSAALNFKYSYPGKNNGFEMQFFAGAMPGNSPGRDYYAFAPSGRSGRELYLYQGEFPDRFSVTENFWSRQMLLNEGALVTPVNDTLGYSKWILSASLASTFPGLAGRLPVKPFVNAVYRGGDGGFMWEAGFKAGIWGFFEVHIPFIVSENISFRNSVRDRLRFIISLESLYKVGIRR